MKTASILTLATALIATTASAGSYTTVDLGLADPVVIAPPAPTTFDGPYVLLGYSLGMKADANFNSERGDNVTKDAFQTNSLINQQSTLRFGIRKHMRNNWVLGGEIYAMTGANEITYNCDNVSYNCTSGVSISGGINLTAGKVINDNWLIYGSIGAASISGHMHHKRNRTGQEWDHTWAETAPVIGIGTQYQFNNGMLLGVGVEHAFTSTENFDMQTYRNHDHHMDVSGGLTTVTVSIGWQF